MAKRKKAAIPPDETAEGKLIRLATHRATRIIKAIQNLGKLSRLNPTSEQSDAVFNALKTAFESAEKKWRGEKEPEISVEIPVSQ